MEVEEGFTSIEDFMSDRFSIENSISKVPIPNLSSLTD